MSEIFADFDFSNFWKESEYYDREYTDNPLNQDKIDLVEKRLGYKLPAAYIKFMNHRNGGAPVKFCHRTSTSTSWA